ncbi:hypothetical protein PsorP6_014850 [Peronosclerospora sorghi]|uniref:Uncharacterized protein n=1 Tax=Peronosclerospora sorghi TaxID=230839 RepID=A0ACC0VT63_9STRA|nr:hypothetical protein PsorP6_014850 [Peronosclerospora sorghi]
MMRVVESEPRWKVQVEGTKKANDHVIDVEVNAEKKMKQQGKLCGVFCALVGANRWKCTSDRPPECGPSLLLSFL